MEGAFEKSKITLGSLADGEIVHDRPNSHLHNHTQIFKEYLKETLSEIDAKNNPFIVYTKKFNEPIGLNNCVSTGSDNEESVTYAIRQGRKGYTRFVRNRVPELTDELTVILRRDDDNDSYILITAFEGPLAAKEPWDPLAEELDKEFWETHALIWNPDVFPFVPGTVRNSRPDEYS